MSFLGCSCDKCFEEEKAIKKDILKIDITKHGRETVWEEIVKEDGTVICIQHYTCKHKDRYTRKPEMHHGELYHRHHKFGLHPIKRKHRKEVKNDNNNS